MPDKDDLFRVAVESAPNAMLLVDRRGRIVLANAAAERLFGHSREDLLQTGIDQLVPPRFRHRHHTHRADFHATPQSRPMGAGRDLYALRKDGSEIPVEIGLNPIKTRDGDFVLAAVVDLTAIKRMQAELVRTQSLAALGEMAATVAHEIKNPLAAISGPLQILADDLPTGDPRKELMKDILGQVKRLDGTVSGLLQFSKPTTPRREAIVLADFIERIGRMAADRTGSVSIRKSGPEGLTVSADPALLEQVFWNLFLNSAEAMKDGGEIRVSFEELADAVQVSIEDSGAGIPPELLGRLFRPFVTTKTSGTGLGLAICRKIMEAHGGSVGISSNVGQGTKVQLRLPKV